MSGIPYAPIRATVVDENGKAQKVWIVWFQEVAEQASNHEERIVTVETNRVKIIEVGKYQAYEKYHVITISANGQQEIQLTAPFKAGSTTVFLDKRCQAPGVDYVEQTGIDGHYSKLQFTYPLAAGTVVHIRYYDEV